jgi:Ulp1 family protease
MNAQLESTIPEKKNHIDCGIFIIIEVYVLKIV